MVGGEADSQPLLFRWQSNSERATVQSRVWTIPPNIFSLVCCLFVCRLHTIRFKFRFLSLQDIPSERLNPSFGCLIQCDNETGRRNFLHPADKHTNNPKKISSSIPVAPSLSAPYTKQQQQWGANTQLLGCRIPSAASASVSVCLFVRISETDPVFRRRLAGFNYYVIHLYKQWTTINPHHQ